MEPLNKQDYTNIIALINKVQVLGAEATTVAILLQKLMTFANAQETKEVVPESTEEKKK